MRLMFDAAYAPVTSDATKGASIAAGYLASRNAAHVWSAADWARMRSWPSISSLLPIIVYGQTESDPVGFAKSAAQQARNIDVEPGVCIALDVEQGDAQHAHDTNFVDRWAEQLLIEGYVPLIYTSASSGHLFPLRLRWLAEWNNVPHQAAGAVATQFASPTSDPSLSVDLSVVSDQLTFAPAHGGAPVPAPIHLNKPVVAVVTKPDGYYLIAADGGVFAFGNVPSIVTPLPGEQLAAPIVAAAAGVPSGLILVGADGGVFAVGGASYHGSIPGGPA